MFGKARKEEKEQEKQKQAKRFYTLLQLLMNELFKYASKNGHAKMPHNVSFGLVHDKRIQSCLQAKIKKRVKRYIYII